MENLANFLLQISPLSDEPLGLLRSNIVADRLESGDYFVREGEYVNEIAFLEVGVVRAFYTSKDGKEYNKTLFSAPAIIGSYASLITKEKNRLPQQALTDCVIWRLDYGVIERVSENNYELERLRRRIAERFFVANEEKELEMALLDAKERYLMFRREHPGLEDAIPQYHIASYLGISPTQLSRIRQKLN